MGTGARSAAHHHRELKDPWADVTVVDVRRKGEDDPGPCPHVAVLQEVDGERTLGIWMLEREAVSLARSLEGNEMPRPMTYQLAAGLVAAGGGGIREVRVTRVAEQTFYAEVVVEAAAGRATAVDARPSDALNLALVAGAPIRVDSKLFPAAGTDEAWRGYPTGAAELGRVTGGAKRR